MATHAGANGTVVRRETQWNARTGTPSKSSGSGRQRPLPFHRALQRPKCRKFGESTALFYKLIKERVRDRMGQLHSPLLLMYSYDFQEIKEMQYANR